MSSQKIARGILSVGIWSATQLVMSALSLPILAHILGPDAFGQFAYYQAILLLAAPLGNFGAHQVMTKFIAERPDDQNRRTTIINLGAAINVTGALAVIASAALVVNLNVYGLATLTMTVAILISILADQVTLFSRGVLYGVHQEAKLNLPLTARAVLSSLAGIGLAIGGFGLTGVIVGNTVVSCLVAAFVLRNASAYFAPTWINRPATNISTLWLIQFSLSAALLSALTAATYRIDLPLVQALAGNEQTGFYTAAAKWAEVVWFIPVATQFVMVQATSAYWVNGQRPTIAAILNRLTRHIVLSKAFLLLVIDVFAEPILRLYFGEAFVGPAWPCA